MSSLFVAEEPDQPEVHVKLEPGVEADTEDIQIKQEETESDGKEEGSNQAEEGDVEMKYYDDEESDSDDEDLDDPIVDTIPLHLNATVKSETLAPLLLHGNNGNSNGNSNSNGNGSEANKKIKNVSVVTMSAKSTKENVPRLGGALLSAKLENEEEGSEFAIVPCDEQFIAKHFVETSNNVLKSKFTQDEYLDLLFEQTKL
ncbi:hypothetical protein PMKS-002421 [Pichia membranifaciens]|uniref:Uncharacterized protein n=1 Tax=Pichia membranifaciens TaxID=4926 RepID=A0A1Q2YHS8_9ASCO|nr:hypothetical protein PMKS-002421 [Pichia membranifaciens]